MEVPGTNHANPKNAEDCMLGLAKSGNKTIRSGFQMDTKVTNAFASARDRTPLALLFSGLTTNKWNGTNKNA
jgi:hypothetical protein